MPHPQERTPVPVTELPNPELNPLLNPTLGRNLGRWAEVYFTSPPDKREEAVVELLRELEGDAVPSRTEPETSAQALVERAEELASAISCPECGQCYSAPQRFCGMCGAPLEWQAVAARSAPPREATVSFGTMTAPLSDLSLMQSPSSAPDRADGQSNIRWLREKNLTTEASRQEPNRVRRFAPAGVAVLAVAALFYAQSRSQGTSSRQGVRPADATQGSTASVPASSPPSQSPSSTAVTTGAISSPPSVASVPSASSEQKGDTVSTPPASRAAQVEAGDQKNAPADSPSASSVVPSGSPASGSEELAQAEAYLNGTRGVRDSAVAARLLWRAVGKENGSAILLLSDLYLIGDGVPKNCDQARLLLNAAARKNVSQAAEKLRNLEISGCP